MRRSNIIKKLLVVTNILLPIFMVLVIIFQNKYAYSSFWTTSYLVMILTVSFIYEVDKGLIDSDLDESKIIKREYNNTTTATIVFYGVILLGIEFVDLIQEGIKNNLYLVCGFYALTLLYELFIFLSIRSAMKETSALLDRRNKKITFCFS